MLVPVLSKRDNGAMNDTHTPEEDVSAVVADAHPADAIADLDAADAPAAAEKYASELAAELDEVGVAGADPVQMQADLGDATAEDSRVET
jgi:hypothetical protein